TVVTAFALVWGRRSRAAGEPGARPGGREVNQTGGLRANDLRRVFQLSPADFRASLGGPRRACRCAGGERSAAPRRVGGWVTRRMSAPGVDCRGTVRLWGDRAADIHPADRASVTPRSERARSSCCGWFRRANRRPAGVLLRADQRSEI